MGGHMWVRAFAGGEVAEERNRAIQTVNG